MSSRVQFNTLQYYFKIVSLALQQATIFEGREQILFLRGPQIVF